MNSNNNIELGFDAHQRGDYQLALNFYDQVLYANPLDAEALSLRGNVLSLLNRKEEAEKALQKAIEIEPQTAGFWLNFADHCVRNGEIDRGCQLITDNVSSDVSDKQIWQFLYQAGLKSSNHHFSILGLRNLINLEFNFNALISLSQLYVKTQQFPEAISLLSQYQSECKSQNSYWHALCWLFNAQRSWSDLEITANQWLANFPEGQPAIRYLASANYELGKLHKALSLYEQYLLSDILNDNHKGIESIGRDDLSNYINVCVSALELEKTEKAIQKASSLNVNTAVILNARAQLAVFNGDLEEAESTCRECIAQFPDFYTIYIQLARIAPLSIGEQEIKSIIEYVDAEHADSDSLAFVLGHHFHAKQEFEAAWKWYKQANYLRSMRNVERGSNYHQSDAEEFVALAKQLNQQLERVCSTERFSDSGDDEATPIFIVGMPRSGSTLLEGFLAQQNTIQKTGERIEFPNLLYGLVGKELSDEALLLQLQEFRQLYLQNTALSGDQQYFIDKNPSNYLSVGLIKAVFPKALIINVQRTAVETIWSIFRHEFSHMWSYATSLENIAHQYSIYEQQMKYWETRYSDVITVQYEAFVSEPTVMTDKLLANLGIACATTDDAKRQKEDNQPDLQHQTFTTLSAVQVRGEIKNLNGQATPYLANIANSIFNYQHYLGDYEPQ